MWCQKSNHPPKVTINENVKTPYQCIYMIFTPLLSLLIWLEIILGLADTKVQTAPLNLVTKSGHPNLVNKWYHHLWFLHPTIIVARSLSLGRVQWFLSQQSRTYHIINVSVIYLTCIYGRQSQMLARFHHRLVLGSVQQYCVSGS